MNTRELTDHELDVVSGGEGTLQPGYVFCGDGVYAGGCPLPVGQIAYEMVTKIINQMPK